MFFLMDIPKIKVSKLISHEDDDHLSQLPDSVLLHILSLLPVNEYVRTTLLSHRWHNLWHNLWHFARKLNFELENSWEILLDKFRLVHHIRDETKSFVTWVNHILGIHLGQEIDDFRIAFPLDDSSRSDIDNWVHFLSAKSVKILELDFIPPITLSVKNPLTNCYVDPIKYTYPLDFKPTLTSVSLGYVNVTTERVEALLNSCPLLEYFSIRNSDITSIRASTSAPRLKHLVVSRCRDLISIDLSAPNLLSFTYDGKPIELNIRDASLLSDISLAGGENGEVVECAFEHLSQYFSQLERLSLNIFLRIVQWNLDVSRVPAMTNLKYLELDVLSSYHKSLLGWTCLIEACPVLQKLTLKIHGVERCSRVLPEFIEERPLSSCLKTLEIFGYRGCELDWGFAMFVLRNAGGLENVILSWKDKPTHEVKLQARTLKVPEGVKLLEV